jgi:peptidoglycan-associated lipoprotein
LALALFMIGGAGASAAAQRQPPVPMTIEMLQMEFVGRTGSDVVYFTGSSHGLDAAAQRTLVAQAGWLLSNPAIRVRIEGHADERTPRDYALAVGERRATAVRDFLVLQGVPAAQLTIISWGKERPVVAGSSEGALALNRRVKTVLMR